MKKIITRYIFYFFIFFSCCLKAQQAPLNAANNRSIDSLQTYIRNAKEDTLKIKAVIELGKLYINNGNFEIGFKYVKQGQELAQRLNYPKGIANSYYIIGRVYAHHGDYTKALEAYFNSLKIWEKLGNKNGISNTSINIGNIYKEQGNFKEALERYFRSLKIWEELGNKTGIANVYLNLGNIYLDQENYENALDSYFKVSKIWEELGYKKGIADAEDNIGNVFDGLKDQKKSMYYHLKALKIRQEINDKPGLSNSYNNVGLVYADQKNYEKALDFHFKSLKISKEIEYKRGVGNSYCNIGLVYMKQHKFGDAYQYLNNSLTIFKAIGDKGAVKEAYSSIAEFFDEKGDYKQALEYHKLFSDIKDTLLNDQSSRLVTEMNTKYDSEKKDKELVKKDAEIFKQQAETAKENLQRNTFIIGFVLVLVLAFFIFRSYRQKQTANESLQEKNELIETQKKLVEKNNNKITDSITYAKRIQQAILPTQELVKLILPQSFVFFYPKDIVSGDFYWMYPINKNEILYAVVDCTGHGVPGALMSIMGYNLLEQVVKEHHIYEPGIILNELSKLVKDSLKQNDGLAEVKDGMDIALCKINYQNKELEYAGAHNPLYLIRNGILIETKADRKSVGISQSKSDSFFNHKIKLEKEDCLYIFSDGYADQKGGSENKKFFYSTFRELLVTIYQLPMEEQKEFLKKTIVEWIGNKEQIDDMLVIGVRI
jgi:serine phosphatase RsbU (regulator of sigma subunit)/Tfp pilus assembly protein PilF